ncbi:hypothetical protein ABZ805_29240 [Saccharopolyspora sp. NPDC047091]|uniref:hypothetical protein n=1 Tax=Saccharopolyspora sp. NPDC047091 TaxID=3155924 RepID=UPI0033E12599
MTTIDYDLVGELHRYLKRRGWIVSPVLSDEIEDDGNPETAEALWGYPKEYRGRGVPRGQ